jgi:hypothetical protein
MEKSFFMYVDDKASVALKMHLAAQKDGWSEELVSAAEPMYPRREQAQRPALVGRETALWAHRHTRQHLPPGLLLPVRPGASANDGPNVDGLPRRTVRKVRQTVSSDRVSGPKKSESLSSSNLWRIPTLRRLWDRSLGRELMLCDLEEVRMVRDRRGGWRAVSSTLVSTKRVCVLPASHGRHRSS